MAAAVYWVRWGSCCPKKRCMTPFRYKQSDKNNQLCNIWCISGLIQLQTHELLVRDSSADQLHFIFKNLSSKSPNIEFCKKMTNNCTADRPHFSNYLRGVIVCKQRKKVCSSPKIISNLATCRAEYLQTRGWIETMLEQKTWKICSTSKCLSNTTKVLFNHIRVSSCAIKFTIPPDCSNF